MSSNDDRSNAVVPDPSTVAISQSVTVPLMSADRSSLFDRAYAHISGNPYFSAGAGLYALGVCGMIGRLALRMVSHAVKKRCIVSLEITNQDPAFNWIMEWMAANKKFNYQQTSLMTSQLQIHANEQTSARCTFTPSPGTLHWFTYRGRPIFVERKRHDQRGSGGEAGGAVFETMELKTVGRGFEIMQHIVQEAQHLSVEKDSDVTVIYTSQGGRWMRNMAPRSRRPLTSIVLPNNQAQELIEDVGTFLQSNEYYRGLGVPYRRGYLLHGPPGCGKSSLVTALAGEMRLAICVCSLSQRGLDDDSLNMLLNTAPLRSIILLEDVDRAFSAESRVTMSGLLNALDGVGAQEGRLVFMTTNHVQKLDAALIRPGRADIKLEIGLMQQAEVQKLFLKFFPDASKPMLDEIARIVPDDAISPAQLQSHLFLYRQDLQSAIASLPSMLRDIEIFEDKVAKRRAADDKIRMQRPTFFDGLMSNGAPTNTAAPKEMPREH